MLEKTEYSNVLNNKRLRFLIICRRDAEFRYNTQPGGFDRA